MQNLLVTRFANTLSSRCGTPAGSTTSRSPPPSRSASARAAATTTSPARCATCCRTTCCSCCAWSRWSRRPTSTARPCATRSSRCCRRSSRSRPTTSNATVAGQYGPGLVDGERRRRLPGRRREPRQHHRDVRRGQGRDATTGAGPACRSTCAPASGWPKRSSEIVVQFKPVPHADIPGQRRRTANPTGWSSSCSPTRACSLDMTAKEPGPGGIRLRAGVAGAQLHRAFQRRSPDAYERLLMDVIRGDPTLFMRRDEVEAAWAWAEPILHELAGLRSRSAAVSRRHRWTRRRRHPARARRPRLARRSHRMTDDPTDGRSPSSTQ